MDKKIILYFIVGIVVIGLVTYNTIDFFKNKEEITTEITSEATTEITSEATTEVIEMTTEISTEDITSEIQTEETWYDTDTDDEEILNEDTGGEIDPNYISH